jgi:hypothetical protein
MSAETAAIWSGILSGTICGVLAIVGALAAVLKGIRDLEKNEIRRHRVECITSLYGLRFILSEGYSPRPEDVARFMFEINRAGALFAEDAAVLNGLRDFYESARSKNSDATDRLITLIKDMAQNTRLAIRNLSDADVRNTFMLANANVVVQFVPVAVQQTGPQPPPVMAPTSTPSKSSTNAEPV